MKTLVFFLEEPSAKEMLEGVLPRFLPNNVTPKYIVFQGKQDLEKKIESRLRGWNKPESYFVVMRDQDAGNCSDIKNNLAKKCQEARKSEVLIRIACRELESFYLGDLLAVEAGLDITGLSNNQKRRPYRSPDVLCNKPAETLIKITKNRYQKMSGSRAIGPHLSLNNSNCSHSFNMLIRGITKLLNLT